MKEAIEKLEKKGYYVCNQYNEFELYKGEEVVIDRLSEAQVIALAALL